LLGGARPAVAADGASVGGHHTMVQAVDMSTHGLGGDSEVAVDDRVPEPRVVLGPRRVIPISLIANEQASVGEALERQLHATAPRPQDARFLLPGPGRRTELNPAEIALLDAIGDGPAPADRVLRSRPLATALDRLVARG